ncbi:hypothetical protein TNCV_3484371 [Trichonephila clavipes]|nr:hypothetical protein TNCV_3484371 [Trichonephila clavipes]
MDTMLPILAKDPKWSSFYRFHYDYHQGRRHSRRVTNPLATAECNMSGMYGVDTFVDRIFQFRQTDGTG